MDPIMECGPSTLQSATTIPEDSLLMTEPIVFLQLRAWATANGAYIHPNLAFVPDEYGASAYAREEIGPDQPIVSCPFSLAITPALSKQGLELLFQPATLDTSDWSERQLICTFLVMHWVAEDLCELTKYSTCLKYGPWLRSLPPPSALRTPLHFNDHEFALLKGTNLSGAATDRKLAWESEWKACHSGVSACSQRHGELFSWERYLTASTYLSSRAFPSTLLSPNPSITSAESSHPVLLPIVDCLNHARGYQVSWLVSPITSSPKLQLNLVIHRPTPARAQLFNNYGPKPNSELLLAYGFVIPDNPDDTIVLKMGGSEKRWEVGRAAKGIEGVWKEVRSRVAQETSETTAHNWEISLDASEMLEEMVWSLFRALPNVDQGGEKDPYGSVRLDVKVMIQRYVKGQVEILRSILEFAGQKNEEAIAEARANGVQIDTVDEGDEDEGEDED